MGTKTYAQYNRATNKIFRMKTILLNHTMCDKNGQIISENIVGIYYLHINNVINTLTKNIIIDCCAYYHNNLCQYNMSIL